MSIAHKGKKKDLNIQVPFFLSYKLAIMEHLFYNLGITKRGVSLKGDFTYEDV